MGQEKEVKKVIIERQHKPAEKNKDQENPSALAKSISPLANANKTSVGLIETS